MSGKKLDHLGAPQGLWWFVFSTGALTLASGSYGVWLYEHAQHDHGIDPLMCALSSLYMALQMLILHTPHLDPPSNPYIETGRWAGAVTIFVTAGLLLWKRLTREFRLVRLKFWSEHHVVCGLGQKGMAIVHCLKTREAGSPRPDRWVHVVVIDLAPDEEAMDKCAEMGVCLIIGDAADPKVLAKARVFVAKEVIVITPEDEINIRIATEIRKVCAINGSQLVDCFIHLSNIHLRERLQKHAADDTNIKHRCRLSFFDVFDSEARRVLLELPLDGAGITQADKRVVHMVILGFGRMGRSLVLRAAKMGHFANAKPLRISVIDRNAILQQERFLFHHPIFAEQKICRLDFHQTDAESIVARKLIEGWAAEPNTLLHLFLCLDGNAIGVEIGLRLQEALAGHADCTLKLRIKHRASLADILEQTLPRSPDISAFGMVEDTCCDQSFRREENDPLARAAHEDFVQHRLGDSSRKPDSDLALNDWNQLQDGLRESNRQQADHIGIKLRSIGCAAVEKSDPHEPVTRFTAWEIEILAKMEHMRWNAERWLSGWRYGVPSNKRELINENLQSWDALHNSIKKYDREAVANIPMILAIANPPMKVVRQNDLV